MKICLISSPGGHLANMIKLKNWWVKYPRFWVTHLHSGQLDHLKNETVFAGCFPENRNIVNLTKNLILAVKIISSQKPDVLISMGAGIAIPFFIIGKLFNCKLIFIETFVFISKPTISGRVLYHLADEFIIQNNNYKEIYPKATVCEWKI